MKKKETILNELMEVAPMLATLENQATYSFPSSYFNQLADTVLCRIQQEALLDAAKNNAYAVPENYFNTLPNTILQTIKNVTALNDELVSIAPLLASINKTNVYSVPENYFASINILQAVTQKPTAKIISMGVVRKWVSYAAAAAMTGVLITGAFLYTSNKNSFDINKEVNKLSDEELQGYLSSNAHVITLNEENNNTFLNQEIPDLKENLYLLSDEELQQYLKENESAAKNNSEKTSG